MKNDKLITPIWSWVLSFCLSLGAVACLVTAFHMAVSLWTVGLWCAVAAALCTVCYCLPLGLLPVSALALISGVLWQKGLKTSIESLLYRLSRQYDKGYGWGVLKLNYLTADDMELRLWLILCFLGVVIAMLTAWAVCRRKTAVPAVLVAAVLPAACFVVTDTVPATPAMLIFFFAMVMLMMTNTVRRQDESRGNRLTVLLSVPVALALVILFTVIPPDGYTAKEAPRDWMDRFLESDFATEILGITPQGGTTGSSVDSSAVDLQSVGVRLESQAEVLRVLTDFDGRLYLRGRALDCYDGTTWTDSGVSTGELYWPDSQQLADGGEVMIMTRYAHRMLYLPYYVRSKDLSGMTKGLENTKKLTEYSFSCDVLDKDSDFYRRYTQMAHEDEWNVELSRYLHLDESVWKWAEPLALQIIEGKVSVYDRAQAIGDYVRNSSTYSTNTYRMPSGSKDFVRWFLEDSDTGYCVHFASAATVLLQAAGIPARYVTGYTVDAKAANLHIVRAKDAHAWVEYWLPGYGWMVLEATPAAAESAPEDPVITDPTEQLQPTQPGETKPQKTPERQEKHQKDGASLVQILLWSAVSLVAVTVALILQRMIRLKLRRKGLRTGSTNEQTLRCWQEVAYLSRLLNEAPSQTLFVLAQKAKFSNHTITEEELAQFHAWIALAHGRLKKQNLFHRLYHRLILVIY